MATKNAACPKCGSKKKDKGALPARVWKCRECGLLYRVSATHQKSLWEKAKRRKREGRGPDPVGPRFKTYEVEIVDGADRTVRAIGSDERNDE